MGSRSKQEVYQNFMDFYQQAVASGNLSPCTGEEQMRQGRLFLNSVPNSGQRFQFLDFYRLALHFIESKGGPDHGEDGFRGLSKGFELLEMLAVNLYLWPWRKEIKSIKTFTGAFVYFIQPAFPPDILQEILEKLGYVRRGSSEYAMARQVNEEEIGHLGFEFFLARVECELMQEMLGQAAHSRREDVVQLRSRSPQKQSDCVKHSSAGVAWSARLGERAGLGNEGATKPDMFSDEALGKLQFPDAPLPLTETNADGTFRLQAASGDDARDDTLSLSRRFPPDSIDLYRDYGTAAIENNGRYPQDLAPRETEQCNSFLLLDQSLMEIGHAEYPGKLSPGQTGPLSLSLYSSPILVGNCLDGKHPKSIPISNSLEEKHPRNKDSNTLDQKGPLKAEADKQEYLEDKKSVKSSQSISSLKCGGFMNTSSQKKDNISIVESKLKNMELEKLPYPTAETSASALFHQVDHFGASEVQGPQLSPPEPLRDRGQWPRKQTQPLAACLGPGVSTCCFCSPVRLLGHPALDAAAFRGSPAQKSGGNVIRRPPQSFYIPPSILDTRPPSALPCEVCQFSICPDCSSTLTASHCQRTSRDCLQIQEQMTGSGSDAYIYITKLPDSEMGNEERSTRCNRCKKDGGL